MPSSQEAVVLKKAITKLFGSPAGKNAVQSVISNAKVAISPSKNIMKATSYTESIRMGASSTGVFLTARAGAAAFSPKQQTTIRMASSISDPK